MIDWPKEVWNIATNNKSMCTIKLKKDVINKNMLLMSGDNLSILY